MWEIRSPLGYLIHPVSCDKVDSDLDIVHRKEERKKGAVSVVVKCISSSCCYCSRVNTKAVLLYIYMWCIIIAPILSSHVRNLCANLLFK